MNIKWEYRFQPIYFMGLEDEQGFFNHHGAEGWELVTVTVFEDYHSPKSEHMIAIFKRPIVSEQ